MVEVFRSIAAFFFHFTFYYPMFMTYLWITGALIYYFRWEKSQGRHIDQPPALDNWPGVSILVPCHNEGANVRETVDWLLQSNYPHFEIIAINDHSSDNTGEILDSLAATHENVRVVHLQSNQGKARALTLAAHVAGNEYLVCIDGDVVLDPWAIHWMVWHLVTSPRVAAVTGNPRIRNRSTLLGRVQLGEFSSIIGLIKRAQRVYGRVFTISGAVSAFRRSALQQVGFWDNDMVTEDISISWKLQFHFWDIRYEPKAVCWLLMPETFKGLWKQRLRWAQGGMEVLQRHHREQFNWKKRRMVMVLIEYSVSVIWAYGMICTFMLFGLGKIASLPDFLVVKTILPGWSGVLLGMTCLLQFGVSMIIDARYDRGLGKNYFWIIWYPVAFWLINVFTIAVGVPKALFKPRGQKAVWVSPDRGLGK